MSDHRSRKRFSSRHLRGLLALGALSLLSACAQQGPQADLQIPVAQEEAQYRARAKSYYAPPGSPEDPWGPYIVEAAQRFDVPELWVRSVIQRESGGRMFQNGQLVTSAPGAMGLMQLMPPTYDEMKRSLDLGDDPYDPHDNIIAGTAYLRQMYDIYGSPGFLAAYNAGPGRLEDFLGRNRVLPKETRNYVAAIGHQIAGVWPTNRSRADLMVASHESPQNVAYAAAAMPSAETNSVRQAWARRTSGAQPVGDSEDHTPVQVAEAPAEATAPTAAPAYTRSWARVSRNPEATPAASQSVAAVWQARLKAQDATPAAVPAEADSPDAAAAPSPQQPVTSAAPPSSTGAGFHLVSPAQAEPAPLVARSLHAAPAARVGTTSAAQRVWAIQVGAFSSQALAQEATSQARSRAAGDLGGARSQVASVKMGRGQLYRARLIGLSREEATAACHRLDSRTSNCVVVSPQSGR